MKNTAAFVVAGLSNTCYMKKPFNPILGETYQATYEDGTQIFCEQSSHHPPVSNWQVFGPDNLYHLYGYGEWGASFRGNAIKGIQTGQHVIEFKDGGSLYYHLPEVWIRGIVTGERVVEYDGVIKMRDDYNKIGCDVLINPPQEAAASWVWGWGAKKAIPTDYLGGSVFKWTGNDPEDKASRKDISKVEGSWLGCIEFDQKIYWDWQLGLPKFSPLPVEKPLPSDCRFREDLIFLKKGDLEGATKWKAELENKQRHEKKLRKDGADKRAPPPAATPQTQSSLTGWFF
jgi:hypothetical protein